MATFQCFTMGDLDKTHTVEKSSKGANSEPLEHMATSVLERIKALLSDNFYIESLAYISLFCSSKPSRVKWNPEDLLHRVFARNEGQNIFRM